MRHVIDAALCPGVATQDPPYPKRGASDKSVLLDRLECVARAGRVIAAHVAVQRRDHCSVSAKNYHRTVTGEQKQKACCTVYCRRLRHLTSAPFKDVKNFTLQGSPRNPGTTWQRTNHELRPSGPSQDDFVPNGSQPPRDQIALDGVTHRLRNDEADTSRFRCRPRGDIEKRVRGAHAATPADRGAEIVRRYHAVRPPEHEELRGELGATLAATGRQDRAAGARTHTETETVDLCPTTVVRLEGSLAHSCISNVQLCM
jgi:hypothetical protein